MDCSLNKTFKDVWLLFLVFYRQFNPIIAKKKKKISRLADSENNN